jgi:hypothetical protein
MNMRNPGRKKLKMRTEELMIARKEENMINSVNHKNMKMNKAKSKEQSI